jgi:FkbM family methyltransferase
MDYNYYIKRWDDHHCSQHVEPFLCGISNILQSYYKHDPTIYIDIGANVGKVYDLIKEKSILNIEKAYLFEGNTKLYSYMKNKYENDHTVSVYNDIILDKIININFDDEYIDEQILNNNEYINFGLSKTNHYKNTNQRETAKISDFFNNNGLLNKKSFIKIDTENSDTLILKDILSIMDNLLYKPIIEFEINYSAGGHTAEFIQTIIDDYSNKYNYKHINILEMRGDGLLVPNTNE